MSELSPEHQRFVEEYLIDLNATRAALVAGISLKPFSAPLGFYVYFLIDPLDDKIFYVGKGKGNRAKAHEIEAKKNTFNNASKIKKIRSIWDQNNDVKIIVFCDDLQEKQAFYLEKAFIDSFKETLTNLADGNRSEYDRLLDWALAVKPTVKPFDKWINERSRTSIEIEMYHKLTEEIDRIIRGDYEKAYRALGM